MCVREDIKRTKGFHDGSVSKESTCDIGATGDVGLILGLGKSHIGGNGNPLQYSCLGNFMDRGGRWARAQRVTKQETELTYMTQRAKWV